MGIQSLSVSYIARVHLKVSRLIPHETNPQDRIKTHGTRGTRDVIWIQDQAWPSPHPQPQARGDPVPAGHLSIYTHSLLLLFCRKMSPWSRRLMSSAESWSSPAPKSMTLKQLWSWRRKFNQRFQRQVMSPVAKKDRHWDPGARGSHEQVSSWLPRLPLPSFLLHQVTSTPRPPGHLCMPHAHSPKALWGPYHIQRLTNANPWGQLRFQNSGSLRS